MTLPGGGDAVVRIRGRMEDLQPAFRRIAEVILQDPRAASSLTIGGLAREAGCSEATVVRLTHELGYAGYRELRMRLAEETAVARERETAYEGDVDPEDDLAAVVGKIAAADTRAVRDTADILDLEVLAEAAGAISGARRIAAFGAGASGLAAGDLHAKLSRVGLMSSVHTDAHDALPAAALLQEQDVAVGISHTGRTEEVLAALQVAAEEGARTIAITNSPASPLAAAADMALMTAAHESAFRSGATASRIAQLTVVDCVFVAVAQRLPDLGRTALARTRAAVEGRRIPS